MKSLSSYIVKRKKQEHKDEIENHFRDHWDDGEENNMFTNIYSDNILNGPTRTLKLQHKESKSVFIKKIIELIHTKKILHVGDKLKSNVKIIEGYCGRADISKFIFEKFMNPYLFSNQIKISKL